VFTSWKLEVFLVETSNAPELSCWSFGAKLSFISWKLRILELTMLILRCKAPILWFPFLMEVSYFSTHASIMVCTTWTRWWRGRTRKMTTKTWADLVPRMKGISISRWCYLIETNHRDHCSPIRSDTLFINNIVIWLHVINQQIAPYKSTIKK
jgi:hypothetical protein